MRRSILCFLAICCAGTMETTPAAVAQSLRFQRIFAPADHRKDWPFEKNVLYLPVEPKQFDQLVEVARAKQSGAPAARGAQLSRATYRARLVDNDLVEGTALLEILHRANQPRVLALDPCSLAFAAPVWNVPSRPRALMGLQSGGKLGVLVEKSGSVEVQWTLRGKKESADSLLFDLALPSCPTKTLILDLPAERVPRVAFGVVTPEGEAAGGRQTWRIELGGRERLMLRLVPKNLADHQRQLTLLRQQVTYDFSLRGIEVSAQVMLDIHHEPIREIELAVDPSLRLIAAHYGETEVPWRISTDTKTGVSDVVLQLPEPVQGSGRAFRLVGVAPLKLDDHLRLPTIRAKGTFWSEGTSRLFIPSPLSLADLTLSGGRQTKADPLPAPRSGDFIEIQHYSPSAKIDVVVSHLNGELALRQGTTIDVGPSSLTASIHADLTVAAAERFLIQGILARGWVIDSVESVPTGNISDWNVEPHPGGRKRLSVHLAKALTEESPLRVNVVARSRQSLLLKPQGIDAFEPLRFVNMRTDRRLVLARHVEPFQLKFEGLQASQQLDPEALKEDRQLLEPLLNGTILDFQRDHHDVLASLTREQPRYRANVQVDTVLAGSSQEESYTIRCIPESTRVAQLRIGFSVSSDVPLEWSLAGERGDPLVAKRIPHTVDELVGREWWEIVLKRPRSDPFELRAVRIRPLTTEARISLAALKGATRQSGTVKIYLGDDRQIQIENDRLEWIPDEQQVVERDRQLRATLRYQPERDVLETPQARLKVIRTDATVAPSAWVYALHLDSSFGLDGRNVHTATYYLHCGGRRTATLSMPPGSRIESLWVNGNRISRSQEAGAQQNRKIELPTDRAHSLITVQFLTGDSPIRSMSIAKPHLPKIDLPVLASDWTFWLPPGYEATGEALPQSSDSLRSWRQRLFGPWGRKSTDPPQRLLGESTDILSDQATGEKRLLETFLRRLGEALQARGGSAEPTWHDVLSRTAAPAKDSGDSSSAESPIRVLVDGRALAASGIAPNGNVRPAPEGATEWRASQVLQAADLAVLVSPEAIILTSASVAALHRSEIKPIHGSPAHQILPGPLLQSLRTRFELRGSDLLTEVGHWTSDATLPVSPWLEGKPTSFAQGGWHAYQMTLSDADSDSVRIVHRKTLQVMGWTTFLLIASLSCWILPGRPQAAVLAMGASASLALLLPSVFSYIATGVFLGVLAGLATLYLRGMNRRRSSRGDLSESSFTLPRMTTALLLIACSVWGMSSAIAQPKAAKTIAPVSPSPIHKVFIPVDAERQSTGERYLVPENLLFELQRRARSVSDVPGGWMIRKASYHGVISREAGGAQPSVDRLQIEYDLHVFTGQQPIEIPFASKELQLVTNEARLEGLPLKIEYDTIRQVVRFEVQEPGDYRLRLMLKPSQTEAENLNGFKVTIPPVALSQVELAVPLEAPNITVPTAQGITVFDPKMRKLSVELGPTNQLVVRWPVAEETIPSTVQFDVDALHWLNVQPGAVTINSQLKINVVAGQIQQLRIAADARLRLLPQEENSPIKSVSIQQEAEQIFVLQLRNPVSDQAVIPIRMLLTGVSGVGNLRLPVLRVIAPGVPQIRLGVSVDASLEYEVNSKKELKTLAVQEFAADWGGGVKPPLLAYQLPHSDAEWTLATHPRQTLVEGDDRLSMILRRSKMDFRYEANLNSDAGYIFQHRVALPPSIKVDQVALYQLGDTQPVRWSRNAVGALTVFFSTPLSGSHRLIIDGHVALGNKKELPLPQIDLSSGTCKQRHVRIFRRPEVVVKIRQRKGLESDAEDSQPEKDRSERLVASYVWDGRSPMRARIAVVPNIVKVAPTSRMVTRIVRDSDQWKVRIDARLEVQSGVLDVLRLELPSWMTAPLQVQSLADLKVVELSGDRGRQIEIHPRASVQDVLEFQIHSLLEFAPGARLRVPHIFPLGLDPIQQYLVLPTQDHLKQISWATRGLRPTDLPAESSDSQYSRDAVITFLIVGETFEAVPRSRAESAQFPRVRLADIRVAWQHGGEYHGVAAFDLEPAGAKICRLHLPESLELIQATVSGVPAMLNSVGTQNWRLTLGPPHLPQRVEVLFRGSISQNSSLDEVHLPCPVLQSGDHAIHVEHSLWTVFSPEDVRTTVPQRATLLTHVHQELLRLRGITSLLDLDTETTAQWSPEEMIAWYRPWARRMMAARDAVLRTAANISRSESVPDEIAEAKTLVAENQDIARRLGTSTLLRQLANQPPAHREPADLWQATFLETPAPTRMMFQGCPGELVLPTRFETASDLPLRLGITLAVAMLATCVVTQHRHIGKLDLLSRWPHSLGVLAGLFWWLWLTPSIIGLVIAILSAVFSFRTHWLSEPQVSGGSTILTLPTESKIRPR